VDVLRGACVRDVHGLLVWRQREAVRVFVICLSKRLRSRGKGTGATTQSTVLVSTKAELETPRSRYIRSDQGFLHEFAADSALEKGVSCELVLWKPNSLLAEKIQGISGIRAQMGPRNFAVVMRFGFLAAVVLSRLRCGIA
jgi:hypothetical protein